MKPFRFRLESVLKYRKFTEKKEMMRLMQLKAAREEIKMSIGRLVSRRSELAQTCSRAGVDGAEAVVYRSYKSYLDALQGDIEAATAELREREHNVKEQEAVLKKETVKKKVLERLRELRLEDHCGEIAKLEQDYLDELVINQRGVPA